MFLNKTKNFKYRTKRIYSYYLKIIIFKIMLDTKKRSVYLEISKQFWETEKCKRTFF